MKIRFVQSCSTDGPSYAAGHTYEMAKAEAQGFVSAGLAVVAPSETETGTLFEDAETATAKDVATTVKSRTRGKK